MSFRATARLAVERETYGEGRPASFHMWESMARHMIESLDCDGAFAKRIDAERMARMLTGALGPYPRILDTGCDYAAVGSVAARRAS